MTYSKKSVKILVGFCVVFLLVSVIGYASISKRLNLYEDIIILHDIENEMNKISYMKSIIENAKNDESHANGQIEFSKIHSANFFQIHSYNIFSNDSFAQYLRAINDELDLQYSMVNRLNDLEEIDHNRIVENYNLAYILMSNLSTGNLDVNKDPDNIQEIIELLYSIRYDIANDEN